jgi:alanine dehydrogenase
MTGIFAIRMKSDVITWPRDEKGNWTEEKYCIQPGTFCGLIFLFSTMNAEPLAIINDAHIQHMRVGGGAGLGVKYLSRADSHVVGMLGSGGMAQTFLEAFRAVRDIQRVKVFSLTPKPYSTDILPRLGMATPRLRLMTGHRSLCSSCFTRTVLPPVFNYEIG